MEQLIEVTVGLLAALQTWEGGKWVHKKLFVDRVPAEHRDFWKKECEAAMDERAKFSRERYEKSLEIDRLNELVEGLRTDVDKWHGIARGAEQENQELKHKLTIYESTKP